MNLAESIPNLLESAGFRTRYVQVTHLSVDSNPELLALESKLRGKDTTPGPNAFPLLMLIAEKDPAR